MKMKMKDSKMMLAMFVVAALAFAGVAGAAYAGENAQAADAPHFIDGNATISTNKDYNASPAGAQLAVTILKDSGYTGTIKFGTGTADTFASNVTLKLTGMSGDSDIVIAYQKSSGSVTVVGDTAGTIEITQGKAVLGIAAGSYFCGKVVGKSATVTVNNAFGLGIAYGAETDSVSGTVNDGSKTGVTKHTVELKGTARVVGSLTLAGTVNMTVAEGAKLLIDEKSKAYTIPTGTVITVSFGNVSATDKLHVDVVDSTGAVVATTAADCETTTAVTTAAPAGQIDLKAAAAMDPAKTYTVYAFGKDATPKYLMFVGTMAFSDNTAAGVLTVTATFAAAGTVNTAGAIDTQPTKITTKTTNSGYYFDNTAYDVVYAGEIIATGGAYKKATVAANVITFPTALTTDNDVAFILLKSKTTGEYFRWANIVTSGSLALGDASTAMLLAASKAADTMANTANVVYSSSKVLSVGAGTTLTVDGTLSVKYAHGSNNAFVDISATGDVNVNGTFVYETDAAPNFTSNAGLNAVGYKIGDGTGTSPKYTYTYTTLDVAMTKSDDITIYGTTAILKDTTLTGTATGSVKNKFTVDGSAKATIGANATATAAAKPAIVTVPTTATLTVATNGALEVVNGQLKVMGATVAAANVKSDAWVKLADSAVNADLTTCLGVAAKDDTVTALTNIDLKKAAEVKADVTLELVATTLTVKAGGGKLTVNGTIASSGAATLKVEVATASDAMGELIVNAAKFTVPTLDVLGSITFGKDFDNTKTGATFSTATAIKIGNTVATPAAVNVIGVFVPAKSIVATTGGTAVDMNVTGTFKWSKLATAHAMTLQTLKVTGTGVFEYLDDNAGKDIAIAVELIMSGKAKLVNEGDTTVTASKVTIGEAPAGFAQVANDVTVKGLTLTSGKTVVVYGKADNVKFMNDSLKTVFKISETRENHSVYKTMYNLGGTAVPLDFSDPIIKGHDFNGWYKSAACAKSTDMSTGNVGEVAVLYGGFEKATYNVTFASIPGIIWQLDGVNVSGVQSVTYGDHKVTFRLESGYEGKENVKVTMNGQTYTAGQSFSLSDAASFAVTADSEPTEKPAAKNEFGIVEIMLVIITIMVVIMAVIIALKLMRS